MSKWDREDMNRDWYRDELPQAQPSRARAMPFSSREWPLGHSRLQARSAKQWQLAIVKTRSARNQAEQKSRWFAPAAKSFQQSAAVASPLRHHPRAWQLRARHPRQLRALYQQLAPSARI